MNRYKNTKDGSVWVEVSRERRPNGIVTLKHETAGNRMWIHPSDLAGNFDPITDEPDGEAKASPASTLDAALPNLAMTFGAALQAVKDGRRIARAEWRGEWVCFMPPTTIPADFVNGRTLEFITREVLQGVGGLRVGGYMVLWTADGFWQPGWLPSVRDITANDWIVLPGKHGESGDSDVSPRYQSAFQDYRKNAAQPPYSSEPMGRPKEME